MPLALCIGVLIVGPGRASEVRILTYNLLAGAPAWETRFPHWLSLVEPLKADIIALQEVEPASLEVLRKSPALAGFTLIAHRGPRSTIRGGLAILTRLAPVYQSYSALPSELGRGLLEVQVRIGADRLLLANVHLDSGRWDTQRRLEQIAKIQGRLADYEDVVWLGDFNFGNDNPEQQRLPAAYRDAWSWLRPADPGITYDREHNPLANANGFWFEPSRRLDRILIRSERFTPVRVELVGTRPDPATGHPPSDHYGVLVLLRTPD